MAGERHGRGMGMALKVNYSALYITGEGHVVVQLVQALRHKQVRWNFSLTLSLRPHYDPVVDSASNRN
jgi:hypothetical protein